VDAEIAYLTIEESAVKLRVSERTVRRWIARGVVPARKLGGTVRVPRDAVSAAAVAAVRPRKGRPRRTPDAPPAGSTAGLSEEVFARTWDNAGDAVYDRWREIYRVPEG
jgi:excisionase family DNA binding protein